MGLTVIVQTCPQRRESLAPTLESLRASDVGERFTLLENPEGVDRFTFFRSVLVAMAEAPTSHVLRLEDDVVVNRHLAHNALSWPALADPMFGCGWLFVPQAATGDAPRLGRRDGVLYRKDRDMWAALAVLTTPAHAAAMLGYRDALCEQEAVSLSQDCFLSRSTTDLGKLVFLHEPSLAENRMLPTSKRWGRFFCRRCGAAVGADHPPEEPSYEGLSMHCDGCGGEQRSVFVLDQDRDPLLYRGSPYPVGMGKTHHLAGPSYRPDWKRGEVVAVEVVAAKPRKPTKTKRRAAGKTKWERRR